MNEVPWWQRWTRRASIRLKLLSALLALALVPLTLVAIVSYHTSQEILRDNASAKLEELAAQTMDKIDRVLFSRSQDMQAWASMEAFQDVIADDPDGRITVTLVRLWSEYGHEASIYCLNQFGQIVASNDAALIGRSVAREPWFPRSTQRSGLVIEDLGYDGLTQTLAVRMMMPITAAHDDRTVIGHLVAHVPHKELQEIIQQVKVHEGGQNRTGHVILVNDRDRLIAGPAFLVDAAPAPLFPSVTAADADYVPAGKRSTASRGAFLTPGSRMLVGFAHSSGYRTFAGLGWTTLVAQDSTEAFGPIKMLRREFLALFIVTTLLVLLVAYAMSSSISIPIQSLTALANRIAAGDLSQTIAVDTQDEVGALATSFNRMTEDLRRSRDELVRTNQELTSARDRAVEVSRLKSHFLANMSHEIRTPMNGILGMTELLHATALTDRQRRLVDTVQRSGQALLQLINDILDFSKIEAGKLELTRTTFDLRQVVEETVDMFAEQAQRKGLTLTCAVQDSVPPLIVGDPGRLRQILINLVGNGLKFTERGGVAIQVVAVEDTPINVILECTVRDSGIGIPREAQTQIFDAFSQADGSWTRKYGGTGLGLSIVKQLVTLMHGTITVQSEPGRGAQFRFTARFERGREETIADAAPSEYQPERTSALADRLHVADASSDEGAAAPRPQPALPPGRILVAEDNPVNQEVARLMLEQLGQLVSVAPTGREAVEALDQGPWDLIFMDCQMPQMDGFAATRAIREREAQDRNRPRTPIIALTAHAIQGDHEQCLAAGMDDYLSKPFTQAQLAAKLRRWLPHPASLASLPRSDSEAPAAPDTVMPPAEALEQTGVVDVKVWKDISSLQQPGRPDVLVTMLSLFLKDSDEVIEQLRRAVERREAKTVFELAHALKSRSGVLGAKLLADLCKRLERAGRGGDLSDASEQFALLRNEYVAVSDRFRRELSRRSA